MIAKLATPLFAKVGLGVIGAQLAGLILLGFLLMAEKNHGLKLQDALSDEVAAHKQTETAYRAAAEKARADDAANALRVERAQEQTTQEVSREYQSQLADLRRRYDAERVRPRAPSTHPGSSDGSAMPSLPDAPGGLDGAAPDYRFACEADALQLGALQDWIRGQQDVPR